MGKMRIKPKRKRRAIAPDRSGDRPTPEIRPLLSTEFLHPHPPIIDFHGWPHNRLPEIWFR